MRDVTAELESAADAIRELARYTGFDEDAWTPAEVAKEALNTLKELQFHEKWNGTDKLRAGHIVQGGTVECIRRHTVAISDKNDIGTVYIQNVKPLL